MILILILVIPMKVEQKSCTVPEKHVFCDRQGPSNSHAKLLTSACKVGGKKNNKQLRSL